jgi:metallo-beta-lactamase class B
LASGNLQAQSSERFRNWNKPVEPFRIIGNIYYVGANEVTSYLISSPDGHILLDAGFEETVPMIKKNVQTLGFRMADIKILLNSHAHIDHAGGLAQIQELTGAKLIIMDADVLQIKNGGKGDYCYWDRGAYLAPKVNRVIQDGDRVELGATLLTGYLTPGHSRGCTTWTMTVADSGKEHQVVFVGSANLTRCPELADNPNYPNLVADYKKTFRVLRELGCDLFLGSHGSFFSLKEKSERLKFQMSPNPFIDSEGYKEFVTLKEQQFLRKLKRQQKND